MTSAKENEAKPPKRREVRRRVFIGRIDLISSPELDDTQNLYHTLGIQAWYLWIVNSALLVDVQDSSPEGLDHGIGSIGGVELVANVTNVEFDRGER